MVSKKDKLETGADAGSGNSSPPKGSSQVDAGVGTTRYPTLTMAGDRLREAARLMDSIYPNFFETITVEWGFDVRQIYNYAREAYDAALAAIAAESRSIWATGCWSDATKAKITEAERAAQEAYELLLTAASDIRSMPVYGSSASNRLTLDQQAANAEYIRQYLADRGWTLEAICGVLGNIEIESHFNPGTWRNKDDMNSVYGLLQFKNIADFHEFAGFDAGKSRDAIKYLNSLADNDPKALIDLQLEYMISTCQPDTASDRRRWQAAMAQNDYGAPYQMSFSSFTSSTKSARELAMIFDTHFERAGGSLQHIYDTRGKAAEAWYAYFTGR